MPLPFAVVDVAPKPSHPNAITCLSLSDTIICFHTCGTLVSLENTLVELSSTALLDEPSVLSQ